MKKNHHQTANPPPSLNELRELHESIRLKAEIEEMQRFLRVADIENRMVFQEEWGDPVDRREYLSDTPGFYPASLDRRISTPYDRRDGKCLPFFETEQDLALIRGIGRFMEGFYTTGNNILETLGSFVVGTGYTYKIEEKESARKGIVKRKPQDGPVPKESLLVEDIEEALCEMLRENGWKCEEGKKNGGLEFEGFVRARRDGEHFFWIHSGDGTYNPGVPLIDVIEPDYITEPRDPRTVEEYADLQMLNWSFGIGSQIGRADRVKAYFVQWEGDPANWDVIDARDIVHCALNVDTGVKRGISDFFTAYMDLEQAAKTLRNTQQGAAIQATIAYIREHVTGTSSTAIESAKVARADGSFLVNKSGNAGGVKRVLQEKFLPGRVIDSQGAKYHAGPLGSPSGPLFIEVVQAGLRMVGSRWQMPEYMVSGDASNANYSSTLISGGPFDRATKRKQALHGGQFKKVASRGLEIMADQGRFSSHGINDAKSLWKAVELCVTAPDCSIRNGLEDESIREKRNTAGILSKKTWAAQVDLDYDEEQANIENEGGNQEAMKLKVGETGVQDQHIPESLLEGERWITINSDREGGGIHVKINDEGAITAGPKALADKGIKKLSDFGKKNSNSGPDSGHENRKIFDDAIKKSSEAFQNHGVIGASDEQRKLTSGHHVMAAEELRNSAKILKDKGEEFLANHLEKKAASHEQIHRETFQQISDKKQMPQKYDRENPWHGKRESVFSEMRKLDASIQREWEQAKKLAPKSGSIGLGSADFDHTLKASVGEEFLRTIRNGGSPEDALKAAEAAGKYSVKQWNEKTSKGRASVNSSHELQRWENAGDHYALGFYAQFKSLPPPQLAESIEALAREYP